MAATPLLRADARCPIETITQLLLACLERRDPYTGGHSRRVGAMAALLARELGLPEPKVEEIMRGSLLHDIGKIGIKDSILLKKGPLTNAEYAEIKRHPIIGQELLDKAEALTVLVPYVRHHHENLDGSGYPDGLREEDIPFECRIVTLADAVDAMTSERGYCERLTLKKAAEEIRRCAGPHFDPEVAEAFERLLAARRIPAGT